MCVCGCVGVDFGLLCPRAHGSAVIALCVSGRVQLARAMSIRGRAVGFRKLRLSCG
jgi:hypothetical protein